MTLFDTWWASPSGFGNFSKRELFLDNYLNHSTADFEELLKEAYEAGYNKGWDDSNLEFDKILNADQ
jgi:hypothetical protein